MLVQAPSTHATSGLSQGKRNGSQLEQACSARPSSSSVALSRVASGSGSEHAVKQEFSSCRSPQSLSTAQPARRHLSRLRRPTPLLRPNLIPSPNHRPPHSQMSSNDCRRPQARPAELAPHRVCPSTQPTRSRTPKGRGRAAELLVAPCPLRARKSHPPPASPFDRPRFLARAFRRVCDVRRSASDMNRRRIALRARVASACAYGSRLC